VKKIAKLSIVTKIVLAQLFIVSLVMAIFLVFSDSISFKSSFYGGLAALIPNLYFARKINKHKGQEARMIVRSFYAGESGKLVMTALIFGLIFQDSELNIISMSITYISALTVFWFALLIRKY